MPSPRSRLPTKTASPPRSASKSPARRRRDDIDDESSLLVGLKRFAYVFFILTMLGLIPLGLQEFLSWSAWMSSIRRFNVAREKYLDLFLEDEHLLYNEPFFQRGEETKNAGPYFNSRIPWLNSFDEDTPVNTVDSRRLATDEKSLTLDPGVRRVLKKWGKDFPAHHSELRYEKYDFTWMHDLLDYDYWDITEASPIEDMFAKGAPVGVYLTQHPLPDFLLLIDLAKVRLMKGLFEGALDEAMEETRHLARLAYSTEDLAGALSAVAILQAEGNVGKHLSVSFHVKESDWEPIDEATLLQAKRAIQAINGLFGLFTPPEVLTEVFNDRGLSVGLCAAFSEGILRALLTRPLLEPQLPLERSYVTPYETLDAVLRANSDRCRLKQLKLVWERRNSDSPWEGLFQRESWRWVKWDLFQFVPYFRKGLGITMAAVFLPKPFPGYEKGKL